eukprot:358445-Chlamydomonas_euryale.AAC.16
MAEAPQQHVAASFGAWSIVVPDHAPDSDIVTYFPDAAGCVWPWDLYFNLCWWRLLQWQWPCTIDLLWWVVTYLKVHCDHTGSGISIHAELHNQPAGAPPAPASFSVVFLILTFALSLLLVFKTNSRWAPKQTCLQHCLPPLPSSLMRMS